MDTSCRCDWCGEVFERRSSRGPAPRFCSDSHRQRAFEALRAGLLPEQAAKDVVWEDPGPRRRGGGGWKSRKPHYEAMKANPGKWLVWSESPNRAGGRGTFLQRKGYEMAQRTIRHEDGTTTFRLYVRWPEQ